VWTHRFGSGRVVYDGLGHDAASIRQPDHARLLTQALAWITGEAA
jgi:type 1 glutamine amidotransferase